MAKNENELTVVASSNISKRDMINIKCASDKIEEHIGEQLTVKGAIIYKDNVTNKETGETELKNISTIVSTDNIIISSPSETFTEFVDDDGEKDLVIELVAKKSNNGRTFFTGKLVN